MLKFIVSFKEVAMPEDMNKGQRQAPYSTDNSAFISDQSSNLHEYKTGASYV
jgi:hypothetical protein